MAGIIADTNVFINAENGRLDFSRLAERHTGEIYIAAITASELLVGVHMAKTPSARMQRQAFVERIIGAIPLLTFCDQVARSYAGLYAQALLEGNRSRMNVHDLQIAATAVTYGYAILTSNVSDFSTIPGVRIIEP